MLSCFCSSSNRENSGDEAHGDEIMIKKEKTDIKQENPFQELIQTLVEKEEQLNEYKEQLESTVASLKNKENRITELEKELSELHDYLNQLKSQFELFKTVKIDSQVEEKDKKIEQLECEVRKHTFNLQGIVNTELWEKNREIEKLQNRLTEKLKQKDGEIGKLEKELMGKDMQLKILKDKIDELGIHVNLPSSLITLKLDENIEIPEETGVMKEKLKITNEKVKYLQKTVEELNQQLRNTPERDSETKFTRLKTQYTQLQQEFDKSEKCRQEMGNVCLLLTNRLEELATFLDSLLKHKSVLGLLGIKQQSAIKNAIDQSLDLSKTFNISLMSEDKSLAQLSSLTGLLNSSINEISMHESYFEVDDEKHKIHFSNTVPLTYNSHLNRPRGDVQNQQDLIKEQTEIIGVLRQQIETMKKEIEVRDTEIAKQNINSTDVEKSLKNDQELVEALMDLQIPNKNLELLSPSKIYNNLFDKNAVQSVDNQSESEAWSEPDRNVSQARIGLDAESLKSNKNTPRSKTSKDSSEDSFTGSSGKLSPTNRTPSKRNSGSSEKMVHILQESVSVLENKIKERDNNILSLQCALMENDNKGKENQLKLHEELENVRKEKSDIENVQRISEKLIQSLEDKKQELINKITDLTQEKENILSELKHKDDQIETLTEKSKNLEVMISQNAETLSTKLQENDNKWIDKFSSVETEAELRINELKEATNQLKEKYETDYIQKEELAKHNAKLEMVYKELESLKDLIKSAEMKEKSLVEREMELTKKVHDSERESREKIIALKRELNEYALRTSQAVLERTKINNEKLRLEQDLRRLETKESEKAAEFSEKEKQYINIKNNVQRQISQLELQKSHLQLKITELETTNVELQNRIMRLQNGETTNYTKSTPTSPIKMSDMPNIHHLGKHSLGNRFNYNRQKSDMSGYNSEDVFTDDNDAVFNRSAPEGCHWFTNVNHNVTEVSAVRNIANSSPDLGIESDPGRFSSLETNVSRPLLQTLELTASMNNLLSDNHSDTHGQYCSIPSHKTLLKENEELHRKLEKTTSQLNIINKNKKQVEKAVCKQIHKTSIVLRKARANLDSGSENEVLRK